MTEPTLSGVFLFDGSDPLYAGHFPGNPVVPGSLVVEAFVTLLRGRGHAPSAVKNFRFRTFLPPGSYGWRVVLDGERAVCTLFKGEIPAVTGEVVL